VTENISVRLRGDVSEPDILTNFDPKAVKSPIGEWLCGSRATLLIASNRIAEFSIYHIFGSRFGIE
jgi:hypothetical protein